MNPQLQAVVSRLRTKTSAVLTKVAQRLVPPPAPTLRRYVVRQTGTISGWAIIVIDTSNGFFATISDYGNYSYLWRDPGGDFRQFLTELEADYFHRKIMLDHNAKVYDGVGTLKAVKELIDALQDDFASKGVFQSTRVADERSLLLSCDNLRDESDYQSWAEVTGFDNEEIVDVRCTKRDEQSWAYCTRVFPIFQATLRLELKEEAEAAS
jgi:hypothetical protein